MRVVAALLVTLLGAGACGGGPSDATTDGVDDSLEGIRALWFGDAAAAAVGDESEAWAEREDAIRSCMASKDQAYVPRPFPHNPVVERQREERRALGGTREYAQRYGFGMTTTMAADEIATAYEQRFPYEDPNLLRLEGLPWQERLPFLEALLGPAAESVRTSPEPIAFERYETTDPAQGCLQKAGGGGAIGAVRLPRESYVELEGIEDRVAADPGVLEVAEVWARCMERHGYAFTRREEALRHASEQTGGAIDIVGETPVEVEAPSGERVTLQVVQYDEAQLQAAISVETSVATADFDCLEESGYLPAEQAARRRAQLVWVERWAAALVQEGD
jgi:hypothetical protein